MFKSMLVGTYKGICFQICSLACCVEDMTLHMGQGQLWLLTEGKRREEMSSGWHLLEYPQRVSGGCEQLTSA